MASSFLPFIILYVLTPYSKGFDKYPTVVTKNATLRGKFWLTRDNKEIEAYLGIRYGKPPVGDLRFEPPLPAEPLTGYHVLDTMPPTCVQQNTNGDAQSEDCLFLNVFKPKMQNISLLPVIVYIYGGNNQKGSISPLTPEYYMDEDILLVTIQYRVGLFGYLSTNDEVVPGNMALKDIRLGLRWLRDNIMYFGGDPNKVTLSAHSSGACNQHAILVFADGEGLFRAAISQSGSSTLGLCFQPPEATKRMIPVLADLSGCPPITSELVKCMKGQSPDEILQLWSNYQATTFFGNISAGRYHLPGLVIERGCSEDRIITENPWKRGVNVPWLVGVNGLEALHIGSVLIADRSDILFSLLNTYFDEVFLSFLKYEFSDVDCSSVPAAIRSFYLGNRPISRETRRDLILALGDALLVYPIFSAIERAEANRTFVYVNEYIGKYNFLIVPLPPEDVIGADHTNDMQFFFPHFNISNKPINSKDDEISKKLVKLWANFATNLKPTSDDDVVQWNAFGPNEAYLNMTGERFSMDWPFYPERMNFWKQQPYPVRDDDIDPPLCASSTNQQP